MKTWIRQHVSSRTYRRLSGIKRGIWRAEDTLALAWFQALPHHTRIALRQRGELVKPLDTGREPIRLHVDSLVENEVRIHSCAKEPETVAWIRGTMRPGDVFYDVGANVGAYSLLAAHQHGHSVQVYAFEPSYLNYHQLCRNIAVNGLSDNVFALPVALADRTGTQTFNHHDLLPGGALHSLGALALGPDGRAIDPVLRQPVLSFRLDDLISQFGLAPPTHLKLDVDGIELTILRGADRTLESRTLRSILVEVDDLASHGEAFRTLLGRKGFDLTSEHPYTYGGPDSPYAKVTNCIFSRNEKA